MVYGGQQATLQGQVSADFSTPTPLRYPNGQAACKTDSETVTVVLALRGHNALFRWSEALGPEDPSLAKVTDPSSLRAKHGIDREHNVVLSHSRNQPRSRRDVRDSIARIVSDSIARPPKPHTRRG